MLKVFGNVFKKTVLIVSLLLLLLSKHWKKQVADDYRAFIDE